MADYFGMRMVWLYAPDGQYYEQAGVDKLNNGLAYLHIPEGDTLLVRFQPQQEIKLLNGETVTAEKHGAPVVQRAIAQDNTDQANGEEYIIIWQPESLSVMRTPNKPE